MLKFKKLVQCNSQFRFKMTCLLILVLAIPASAQQTETKSSTAGRRVIFTVTEQMPEFPGGMNALQKYMEDNLRFPEGADKKFQGQRVYARFIITETGSIDSAKVLKPVNDLVDAEVLRVIRNMPAWRPGKQNGHEVAVWFNIPIHIPEK
jgi:protein TonB